MDREEQLIKTYILDNSENSNVLKEEIEKITYEEIGKYIGYKDLSSDVNKILDMKNEILGIKNVEKILESSLLLLKGIENIHHLKENVIDKKKPILKEQKNVYDVDPKELLHSIKKILKEEITFDVGEEKFISNKELLKSRLTPKKGNAFIDKKLNTTWKFVEEDEYPQGNSGWWARRIK